MPTRVGECERATSGVGIAVARSTGRWDREGQTATNSLQEHALVATWSSALRLDPRWQLGVDVPVRLSQKQSGSMSSRGGGAGDLLVHATWDPMVEQAGRPGRPVPVLSIGLTLPTGRGTEASTDPLQSDVTGLGQPALTSAAGLERTLGRWPWSAAATGTLTRSGAAGLALAGSLGRYLNHRWTVTASLAHEATRTLGTPGASSTHRTTAAARVLRGQTRAWRAWIGTRLDLPVDLLGRSHVREATVDTGIVRTW